MKKMLVLLLAMLAALSAAVCGMAEETPAEVTITCINGNSEEIEVIVPYNPERVVVLDLATLDILDNLGLGDHVAGVPTITLDYLKAYEAEKTIVGTVKTPDLEAIFGCEPEIIFMAGRGAEYYDALSEIAPVVRLISDTGLGLVESIRRNATIIGSIFGEEEKVEALLSQYDARIAALAEFAEGKTAVLGMCTSGSFSLLGNDGRCALIVNEIGFENIGAEAASVGSAGGSSENSSTPTHGNEVSFEAVVAMNPEYIFVMDRDSAIGTDGAQLAQEIMENELIMKTDAYQNGNLVILEHPGIWYLAEGGVTSLGIMLSDLETALLAE